MTTHRQVTLESVPEATVDEGIRALVTYLNEIGATTRYSCQSEPSGRAMIVFTTAEATEKAAWALLELAGAADTELRWGASGLGEDAWEWALEFSHQWDGVRWNGPDELHGVVRMPGADAAALEKHLRGTAR